MSVLRENEGLVKGLEQTRENDKASDLLAAGLLRKIKCEFLGMFYL